MPGEAVTAHDVVRPVDEWGARQRLRRLVTELGVSGAGQERTGVEPVTGVPFGSAEPVEHDVIRTVPIEESADECPDAAFADGIQRFAVEGWLGVTPVVHAQVSAAVLWREGGKLRPVEHRTDEFIVIATDRLATEIRDRLVEVGLPIVECEPGDRPHPMVDLQRAVSVVERRRRALEFDVCRRFRARYPAPWLVIDGAIRSLGSLPGADRLLGAIRSHETQLLAGADLQCALTLPAGHRTSVFRRGGSGRDPVYSWYVRLWDWTDRDILYGLVRLERPPGARTVEEVDDVSRWIRSERVPVAAQDRHWDRLLYPIHQVQTYLRAKAGGWR